MPATGSTTGVPRIPSGLTFPHGNVGGDGVTGVATVVCQTMPPVPAFKAVIVLLRSTTISRLPTSNGSA